MIKENLYTPDCIRTYTGKYVNVFNPDPETICIEDIAHSLSMQCRFGGHLRRHYSVAEHCENVAANTPEPQYKLASLLHDASEAYLLDIPSPIKAHLPDYKKIEDNLMQCIAKKFGFEYPLHESVKKSDKLMLEIEWREFVLLQRTGWTLYTHDCALDSELTFIKLFNYYSRLI